MSIGKGIPFGKYRLTRRLARGGMAEVFLATQQGPGDFERTVAVKRILPHLADTPQFLDMFMDEARLAAQLSHSNIAHIYEFGSVDDSYFIAMEYVEGVDLSAVILKGLKQPIPFEHAARIIADLCSALYYAHQQKGKDGRDLGLVHRDISPQNILVSFDGIVKVVDFGIAKAAHHIERTRPGVVRGKFSYMSPEQVRGKPLDRRSDLFSAGIVLYELCTAETLFSRTNAVQAMQQIRNANVLPPTRNGQPIPKKLARILRRSLARERDDRYQTAAEMQMDLEEYLRTASQITNSILLGEYFQVHYGNRSSSSVQVVESSPDTKKAPVAAGTVDVANGGGMEVISDFSNPETAKVVDTKLDPPHQLPQLDQVSGIIFSQPTAMKSAMLASTNLINPLERKSNDSTAEPGDITSDPLQIATDSATVEFQTDPGTNDQPKILHNAPTVLRANTPKPSLLTSIALPFRSYHRHLVLGCSILLLSAISILIGTWVASSGEALKSATPPVSSYTPKSSSTIDTLSLTTAVKKRSTGLDITSKPLGASVKIDGRLVLGKTPLYHPIKPGTYNVLVSQKGYEDQKQQVIIDRGQVMKLNFILKTEPPKPDVGPPPPSPTKTAKKPTAVAKVKKPARPTRRVVRRRLHVPKLASQRRHISRTKPLTSNSKPPTSSFGYLSITTIPWSTVYLDNRKIGITPLANIRVKSGNHRLKLMNPARPHINRSVQILPEKVTKLRIRLP